MSDLMRLTGLSSGMDTESIVSALVSAKKTKVDEAKQAQTKLEWTQDAWKSMNSKIYGLYSGKLSAMRFSLEILILYLQLVISISTHMTTY